MEASNCANRIQSYSNSGRESSLEKQAFDDPGQIPPVWAYSPYLDNGPVAKSRVFQNVVLALDIEWLTHIPAGKARMERARQPVQKARSSVHSGR